MIKGRREYQSVALLASVLLNFFLQQFLNSFHEAPVLSGGAALTCDSTFCRIAFASSMDIWATAA